MNQRPVIEPSVLSLTLTEAAKAPLSHWDLQRFSQFAMGPQRRPRFATVSEAIAHYCQVQPQRQAVRHLDQSISYAELAEAAERLAIELRQLGVEPGDAVCLYLRRGVPMVVGIVAVLWLGACYVPQDVAVTPAATLGHLAEVCQAKVVLTEAQYLERLPQFNDAVVVQPIEALQDRAPVQGFEPAPISNPRTQRAFILFTSGTTGTPNGVQVSHQNLANAVLTAPGNLGIRPGTRVAQMLSIAFDMAAWEILGCLANGGSLQIRGRDFQTVAESAQVLIATPSVLGRIDPKRCAQVHTVAVAGEPCPRALADRWSAFTRFYNACGPTETTIINTAEPHYPAKPVLTIGRPTPNNTVYVLNAEGQPCALGEVGEMWAGGDGVTLGYIGNDALTAERYRPDPFLGGGRLMFRTRDLARWTADGELVHCGRVDDQVKIRGFRVELDGIARVLESVEGCQRAVVIQQGKDRLVAFAAPHTLDKQALRQALSEQLPYYCLPSSINLLPELPLTERGKVDKRALLAKTPMIAQAAVAYAGFAAGARNSVTQSTQEAVA